MGHYFLFSFRGHRWFFCRLAGHWWRRHYRPFTYQFIYYPRFCLRTYCAYGPSHINGDYYLHLNFKRVLSPSSSSCYLAHHYKNQPGHHIGYIAYVINCYLYTHLTFSFTVFCFYGVYCITNDRQ